MKEYNELIEELINILIDKKDMYAGEISDIATYQHLKQVELDRLDIAAINEKRRIVYELYNVIDDLEYLKERRKLKEEGEPV